MNLRSVLAWTFLTLFGLGVSGIPAEIRKAKLPAMFATAELDVEIFDLAKGNSTRLKWFDFQNQVAFDKAVSNNGDIYYSSLPDNNFLVVNSSRVGELSGKDMGKLAGKDLSEYLKDADSVKIQVGTVLLIQTRKKTFALLQVLGTDGRLTFQWLYRDDGKAIFPEIPFEDLTPPKNVKTEQVSPVEAALAAGREVAALRKRFVDFNLLCLQALENRRLGSENNENLKLTEYWENKNKYEQGRLLLSYDLFFPVCLEPFSLLKAEEGAWGALNHPDAAYLSPGGDKEEIAVELLKKSAARPRL